MKLTLKRVARLLPLLLIVPIGNGCTYALWTNGGLDNYKEPAPNPNLRLYASRQGQDVLVVYSEYSERHETLHARAYWLGRNQDRVAKQRAPVFVRQETVRHLPVVPLFSAMPDGAIYAGYYAVCQTNQQSFTLYSGSDEVGFYELPVYKDRQGTVEKIALTPVALTADATVAGAAAAVYVAYGLAQSGESFRVK